MPRRSGGRSSGGRSSSRSSPRPDAKTPKPAPAAQAPPPQPMQKAPSSGGFLSTIADGLAFGGGNAVAHRVMDAVMGPRVIKHETVASEAPTPVAPTVNTMGDPDACGVHSKAFQDCLNQHGSEINKCQFYMDMLSECRKNSSTGGLNV
ncbi:hypothetical protein ACJIZ3_017163 [Penstemon smallii]|uniref:CHCH domain-containing protein n=1 Tax=Penstemon smallii TaxID=265156 RepID=A0ABD3SVD8_9LAMI